MGKTVAPADLSAREREQVSALLSGLRRDGITPLVYQVEAGSHRSLVVLLAREQDRERERLTLWGCRLGAPAHHEAGSTIFSSYDRALDQMSRGGWSDRDKATVRAFIQRARRRR